MVFPEMVMTVELHGGRLGGCTEPDNAVSRQVLSDLRQMGLSFWGELTKILMIQAWRGDSPGGLFINLRMKAFS